MFVGKTQDLPGKAWDLQNKSQGSASLRPGCEAKTDDSCTF